MSPVETLITLTPLESSGGGADHGDPHERRTPPHVLRKASKYAGHYSRSRDNLVHKMRCAGLKVVFAKGTNDKHIAIISCDPIAVIAEGKRAARVLRIAA